MLQADAQRLTDVFRRDGAAGLTTFIDARVGMQIAGERILLLTDSSLHPLAGNLAAWPRGIPRAPGNYTLPMSLAGEKAQRRCSCTARCPGATTCWLAATSTLFAPLSTAVLVRACRSRRGAVDRGYAGRTHHPARAPAAGRQHPADRSGHHARATWSHRLPTQARQRRAQHPVAHHQRHARSDRAAGARSAQRLEFDRTRSAHAAGRAALPPRGTLADPAPAGADLCRDRGGGGRRGPCHPASSTRCCGWRRSIRGMRRSGFVAVDAADIAASAVEFYLPAAELRGIALSYQGSGPVVSGDPVLLAQAIGNLIDNALKYTPGRGRHQCRVQTVADARRCGSRLPITARESPMRRSPRCRALLSRRCQPRHTGSGPGPESRRRRRQGARRRSAAHRQQSGIARAYDHCARHGVGEQCA